MAITNDVKLKHDPAFAGQIGGMEVANKISKVNTSTASIPYGLGVVRDGQDGFKLPTTATVAADFLGVPERAYQDITLEGEEFGTRPKHYASVVTMGTIWVKVSEDVAAGDAACLCIKAGSEGTFCKTAKDSEAIAIPAVFREGAEEGGLALIAFRIGG